MSQARRRPLPRPPLLLITDRRQCRGPLEGVVDQALTAGCRWLLLREKDLPDEERRALGERLRRITAAHGALLSLSNDLELAGRIGADGVHLSRDGDPTAARDRLGAAALIGRSAHDVAAAQDAFARGADYVTLSPVFASASKPGYGPALGPEGLHAAAAAVAGPLLALGGVTPKNAGSCLAQDARGLAVMGEIMRADDPGEETAALLRAMTGCA